jgi:hypothetical protein
MISLILFIKGAENRHLLLIIGYQSICWFSTTSCPALIFCQLDNLSYCTVAEISILATEVLIVRNLITCP